jgi:hypothetical protein
VFPCTVSRTYTPELSEAGSECNSTCSWAGWRGRVRRGCDERCGLANKDGAIASDGVDSSGRTAMNVGAVGSGSSSAGEADGEDEDELA